MGLVPSSAWPSRYIERAARFRREEGIVRLSSRLVRKLLSPIADWGRITFFERTLDAVGATRVPDGVTIREVHAAELALIAEGIDPEQRREEITHRFRRGDRVFAALDATGGCAHTRWLVTRRAYIPEIDRDIVLSPGQAYFYNGYTRPDCRGRGIDGAVRQTIFTTLRSEGYAAAYSYARGDNYAGFRAASRWQRPVRSIWFFRLRGFRPLVFGAHGSGPVLLDRPLRRGSHTHARADAWRQWFQGFAGRPLAQRSTGCDALPDAYFESAAAYIRAALRLEPSDTVLDVGCDSAMISRLIAPHCHRFAGVDLIPAMLRDARDRVMAGSPARLIAADGRRLPVRDGAFRKVYCSAMLHTLPTRADGLRVIDELVRVTADGGLVLVSSVPDRAKRVANRIFVWRRAPWPDKLTLPIRWLTPALVKQAARRVLRRPAAGPPAFLDYDLRAVARALEARGLHCDVQDFPDDYWSADFRTTRSNLLITVTRPDGR